MDMAMPGLGKGPTAQIPMLSQHHFRSGHVPAAESHSANAERCQMLPEACAGAANATMCRQKTYTDTSVDAKSAPEDKTGPDPAPHTNHATAHANRKSHTATEPKHTQKKTGAVAALGRKKRIRSRTPRAQVGLEQRRVKRSTDAPMQYCFG